MSHPLAAPPSFSGDDPVRAALERAIGFQYDIIRLLGRGGMGAVYHAHEKALDRPVAIKVLPPDSALGDARERFLREARTAARLTHPNIVPLLTFGETQGLVYFVMGYVDGESLEQRLRRSGPLDADSATRMLDQLANALDYAHGQGIVHRDVKPDNILIERGTGVAKLTDFGIAKSAAGGETLTGTGLLMGTPRYMSPEQASGDRDLDARSDVYSLGLVGYAMLTGRPPFEGSSVQEILTQQVTRDAPNLRKLLPDAPSAAVSTIERALKKDPGQRWPTAAAMGAALREEDDAADDGIINMAKGRKPGTYALSSIVATVVTLDLVWFGAVRGNELIFVYILPIMALGFAFDYATMRWKEKRSGAEIRRIFTEPPQWWPFWWPARWRRRDDVWSRLPRALRRMRLSSSVGIASFAAAMQSLFMAFSIPDRGPVLSTLIGAGLALVLVSLFGLVGAAAAAAWWSRKQGLTYEQANRLMSAPTGRARFWNLPWVSRLLEPAGDERQLIEPQTPAALADAIAAMVHQLPALQRDSVSGAGDAARGLANAIDALDAELAILARDADGGEVERLKSRIAALGAASPNDSPGQREMRQLYSSQLDLLERLTRQREELVVRRGRFAELLRTLWLQLSTLRAEHAADALRVDDLSGRIRHIVRNVELEVDGAREAGRIVARST